MDDDQSSKTRGNAAESRYRDLLQASEQRLLRLRQTDGRYAMVRLVLFAAALVLLSFAFFASPGVWVWVIGWSFLAGFILAAILNEPVRDSMEREARDNQVTERLLARMNRDWEALDWKVARKQLATVRFSEHQKDVADDLDLLGKTSLYQFVSMAGTTIGARTLADWLAGAAEASVARERAAAIRKLAPRHEQRHRFYSLADHVGRGTGDPDQFVRWAGEDSWLQQHRWMLTWAKISAVLAAILIALLVGSRIGLTPTSVARLALLAGAVLVAVNVVITTVMLGPVHQIFSIAMASRDSVREYRELFSAAQWLSDDIEERDLHGSPGASESTARLDHLQQVLLHDPERSARTGMNALQRVAAMGSMRSSAATFLLYVPLQIFGLWDVRVLEKLEAWQRTYGSAVPGWFDAFGELEALMSLAALRDENPDWVFPDWVPQGEPAVFQSVGLGHPLIRDTSRVCNDVQIGPPGTVLLVTGSNMSGKSTMLRSVGLNVALAGAGAPVCARRLSMPSTELATSIRVRDNLAEGVSFYMAELHRLKGVVDHARELSARPDRVSLFLLDEILQGTNSRERQIAVTQVLQHLIECEAIGAISTHDLELADEPALMKLAHTVHFRETIEPDPDGNDQMTFDYQMRSGVSPTTNALRLLEIVGLGRATEKESS
ncbi:DNA mismatch repair protein [Roseiconus nitratireducens]|uniref:DNA mismatch repair protein n=1 Tax=Roseiconus nitratireducens TaxID=2605748 RepID=A0A5M6D763_9BACT|nr:MutS family DNA mismatch repair protein [Roseiconus nitratireducens]KAA5541035.1 DNA mismatch repair protein [Roseiconus nitratireducens]